ncbi:MAG TPA: heat-inducible transcriptional repressor HrcA [Vicinamibacterales bacterium]|nr:heat-inducible transcriptional repressor HrcA [Vicinamibacterales bacterium]
MSTPRLDLTDRQRRILARLVAEFIEQGEPVSSLWLAERSGLGLSSATVRNILARLEELGLVKQPHTSAGRVPTDQGYRTYVDLLMENRRRMKPSADVEARLRKAGSLDAMLDNASQELSRASHHIGFAVAMAASDAVLQHIDFVPLDSRKMLVVVVSAGGQVTHKMVEYGEGVNPVVLRQAANYVNAEFAGLRISEAREALLARLQEERTLYDELLQRALELAQSGLEEVDAITPGVSLFIQGASTLFEGATAYDERLSLDTLRSLFRMIEEKHRLVELLTQYIEAPGVTVVIGTENPSPDLHPFSVVASTYQEGDRIGAVGVIGPTRMRYQKSINVVDGVAQVVTRVFDTDISQR